MAHISDTPPDSAQQKPVAFGLSGLLLGGFALCLVLVHFVSGPFAPQQELGVTLGELTSDIFKSAARDMVGRAQPAPETIPWNIDRILRGAKMAGAVVAMLLGLAALLRGAIRLTSMKAVSTWRCPDS